MAVVTRRRACALLLSCPMAVAAAQAPPGAPVPGRTAQLHPDLAQAVQSRVDLGKAAAAAGQHAEALEHFGAALPYGPAEPALLLALLRASAAVGDADARALHAIRYCAAAGDARGRCRSDREVAALLGGSKAGPALAAARAAAVSELAGFAGRRPRGQAAVGFGVQVRFLTDVAWQLMRSAPALQEEFGGVFGRALDAETAEDKVVLAALRKVVGSRGDDAVILRAARCLTGLAAQAGFEQKGGPKAPAMRQEAEAGRRARAEVRARVEARAGAPLTVDQLRQMTKEQREAFTAAHATWADPGIAVSPNGRYVVQTVCGHGTLLGAVETIEMHHARLAAWCGKDPFAERPGLVRIVPDAAGLESEDTPHWWAAGFQRGDETTVQFHWSSIADLGRLLTHELTHRFDGTLHAFVPAWLLEGRAVWTAAAYGAAEDRGFVERHLDFRTCSRAFSDGYGDRRKLEQLLTGKTGDYRDNYTAGYALFVYLKAWRDGDAPLFAAALDRYLGDARAGRRNPLAWFARCFADGEQGRPKGMEAFAKGFHAFLEGCYQWGWGTAPSWARRFELGTSSRSRVAPVLDEPTWIWDRRRAEPWFGQRHAADAGLLLADLGQDRAAIAGLLWSLATDDWQVAPAARLAGLLEAAGQRDIAWTVRAELAHRHLGAPAGPSPLLSRLPKLRAYLQQLDDAAAAAKASGHAATADHLAAERNDLARRLGLPEQPAAAVAGGLTHLALHGYTESGLTGFEDRRHAGLWFQAASGDLHVGRQRPRGSSGLLDRVAHQRDAFVRTVEWFGPGHYVLRTRVHFTTSYVSGAIVLGHSRRDRGVRLSFSAGDFHYSVGRKAERATTREVAFDMGGLWVREGEFEGAAPRQVRTFDTPVSGFALEVRVFGPTARVFVEGEHLLSYTTADLSPILGSIGVAMRQGAVRLQEPLVQRLPATGAAAGSRAELIGRQLPGVPRHPHGTLVVWLPADGGEDGPFDYERWTRKALDRLQPLLADRLFYPQARVMAVPAALTGAGRQAVARLAAEHGLPVVEHRVDKPLVESVYAAYLDAQGGVRHTTDLLREGVGVPEHLERWLRRSRARR